MILVFAVAAEGKLRDGVDCRARMKMLTDIPEDIYRMLSAAVESAARTNPHHVIEIDAELAHVVSAFPADLPISREELRTELARLAVARGVAIMSG